MPELIYPELSYTVQGAFYDVYNELCHFDLSEQGWESGLLKGRLRPAAGRVRLALQGVSDWSILRRCGG
jgi:hypothetical protein